MASQLLIGVHRFLTVSKLIQSLRFRVIELENAYNDVFNSNCQIHSLSPVIMAHSQMDSNHNHVRKIRKDLFKTDCRESEIDFQGWIHVAVSSH